jgi:hypothetical protein
MDEYFTKFPIISYNDVFVTDISRKVVFDDAVSKLPTFFYPYELSSGVRSDVLSYSYYEDPSEDWLIYLSNGIIDPYHGWYLSVDDFEKFIKKKYGSIENSQRKIKYWALDAFNGESNITASFYNNNIPNILKKYFSPIFGAGTNIIAYTKREDTWTVNTNKIVEYEIDPASIGFLENERVALMDEGNNVLGYAEIIKVNSNSIIVQNIVRIDGNLEVIVGETSGIAADFISSTILSTNISDEEVAYWTPIYFYDHEYEKNEANKFVKLLDSKYVLNTSEEIRKKLQE